MASSCKHECKNKHDSFCHVCGCYTLPHQKRNITLFVKHTYKAYFQIPLGNQDKKCHPISCVISVKKFFAIGKRKI